MTEHLGPLDRVTATGDRTLATAFVDWLVE